MSVIKKGRIFANGEQLTAEKLNVLVDEAEFNSSTAVDNSTTRVSSNGAITVNPLGITSTELAPSAVTTAKLADSTGASDGVTTAKIATGAVTSEKIGAGEVEFSNLATSVLSAIYPVGSVYINASDSTNPSTLLGFGTWEFFSNGRVLVGIDGGQPEFNSLGEYGGAKTVKLTAAQSGLPLHRHLEGGHSEFGTGEYISATNRNEDINSSGRRYYTSYNGGFNAEQSHTNMQPYIVVCMWKRTA